MLKLLRRDETAFLTPDLRTSLRARQRSAAKLAIDGSLTAEQKSKRIQGRWDAFRAGKTSAGVFDAFWGELGAMSFGKCAICETSGPNTVEHLREKGRFPAEAFDWNNLLPACGVCNLHRQNSAVRGSPIDPTQVEPLDLFGWDRYGRFAPRLQYRAEVKDHVTAYRLDRFDSSRAKHVAVVRALLASVAWEDPIRQETADALQKTLSADAERLGPVREHLLRPPHEDDAVVLDMALKRVPEIRDWVRPWLRPPAWAGPRWA